MTKIKLFYSYSHKDENYRDELEKHLTVLRNDDIIEEWHDRKIIAGNDWDEKIDKNMEIANIILLLISSDFIASSSCQKEIKKAFELRKEKGTSIIPIILRKCAWLDIPNIKKLQALPTDGKPIKLWDDKDSAWSNVYKGIKENVNEVKKKIKLYLNEKFEKEIEKTKLLEDY